MACAGARGYHTQMSGQTQHKLPRAGIAILCWLWLAVATRAQDEAEGALAKARELALAGRHVEAVSLYEGLATEIEQQEGGEAWSLVFLFRELAVQHHMLDALGEAEALYRRSLAIAETHRGARDPALVPSLRGLATIAATRGRLDDAESLYRRALEIQEASEEGDAGIAQTLSELGLLSQLQGRSENAESFYRRALETGDADPLPEADIAIISANLGALYDQQERLAEAESLFRRALEIRERLLAPDHPDLARMHEKLGSVQYRRSRFADAASSYERSLQIRNQSGQENLALAEVLGRLAACYRQLGRSAAAEAHFGMAKATLEAQCTGRENTRRCRDALWNHRDLRNQRLTEPAEPMPRPVATTAASAAPPPTPEATPNPPPAPEPAAPPKPAPPSATASVPGRAHRAQVGAREDPREAAEILAGLRTSHPQLLGDLVARVVSVDLEERGVWHRVQIGEFQELDEAKDLCAELVRRGHEGCWVITTED